MRAPFASGSFGWTAQNTAVAVSVSAGSSCRPSRSFPPQKGVHLVEWLVLQWGFFELPGAGPCACPVLGSGLHWLHFLCGRCPRPEWSVAPDLAANCRRPHDPGLMAVEESARLRCSPSSDACPMHGFWGFGLAIRSTPPHTPRAAVRHGCCCMRH
jgi:hypothetical protein